LSLLRDVPTRVVAGGPLPPSLRHPRGFPGKSSPSFSNQTRKFSAFQKTLLGWNFLAPLPSANTPNAGNDPREVGSSFYQPDFFEPDSLTPAIPPPCPFCLRSLLLSLLPRGATDSYTLPSSLSLKPLRNDLDLGAFSALNFPSL